MGIVVDTNVFIDLEHNRLDISDLDHLKDENLYLSVITVAELRTGVFMATDTETRQKRKRFTDQVIDLMPILNLDEEVATEYAWLYAYIRKNTKRQFVAIHDMQIAATALVHGYRLLTGNVDNFKDIPNLEVISPK